MPPLNLTLYPEDHCIFRDESEEEDAMERPIEAGQDYEQQQMLNYISTGAVGNTGVTAAHSVRKPIYARSIYHQ